MSDYLWDGSSEPEAADIDIQRLESLLGRYRSMASTPDFRRVAILRRRPRWRLATVAAAIITAVIVSAFFLRPRTSGWRATAVAGSATLPDRPLRTGDIVRTDSTSRIRLESSAVGVIYLGGATTVRLIESRTGRQKIALEAGEIHARTTSPPGVFVVDTPRARAIDLGCEYVLSIAPGGGGELRVIAGWVDLTHGFEQSLVPQGASATVTADGQITMPLFDDAAPPFRAAVRNFARTRGLATILALSRPRDAFTLLNLFRVATPDERVLIFDRLNQLVPAPPSIPREAVRDWQPGVTEPWWRPVLAASGLQGIRKKKGMLNGL